MNQTASKINDRSLISIETQQAQPIQTIVCIEGRKYQKIPQEIGIRLGNDIFHNSKHKKNHFF